MRSGDEERFHPGGLSQKQGALPLTVQKEMFSRMLDLNQLYVENPRYDWQRPTLRGKQQHP